MGKPGNVRRSRSGSSRRRGTRAVGSEDIRLIRKRVKAGDPGAIWLLAQAYEDGVVDASGARILERDHRKAVRLYRRGAERGDVGCMLNLANHLTSGSGVRKDLHEALRWELRAARRGDQVAAENAGLSYKLLGKHGAAVKWFRRALAMGNESACLEVAKAELWGRGTRRNVAQAMENLRRVSNAGAVLEAEREEARLLLAYLHIDGWLLERSRTDALRWLREAEAKGSTIAAAILREQWA